MKMFKVFSLLLADIAFLVTSFDAEPGNRISFAQPKPIELPINPAEEKKINYRLPSVAKPRKYDLHLDIYMTEIEDYYSQHFFKGIVKIYFTIEIPTDTIILHSSHLEVQNVQFKKENETVLSTWNHDRRTQFLKITSQYEELSPNHSYSIEIKFKGYLSTKAIQGVGGFLANAYNGNKYV